MKELSIEEENKILKDKISRLEDRNQYLETLVNWYKEARDRAIEHADETIKKFSWGI